MLPSLLGFKLFMLWAYHHHYHERLLLSFGALGDFVPDFFVPEGFGSRGLHIMGGSEN